MGTGHMICQMQSGCSTIESLSPLQSKV